MSANETTTLFKAIATHYDSAFLARELWRARKANAGEWLTILEAEASTRGVEAIEPKSAGIVDKVPQPEPVKADGKRCEECPMRHCDDCPIDNRSLEAAALPAGAL
jgi:hypothetical protein